MLDMTQGKPWKVLLRFAIPLMLSGIIQQFYNLADSLIVGNFADIGGGGISGEQALAAVGASSVVTALFVMLGSGASMGCGVVISQLYGAKRYGDMKTTLFTSLIFFGGLSIVLSAIGAVVSAPITRLLNTPEDVFPAAVDYLSIYTYGLPFLFIYNVCNAVFNAMGDSKKPLGFLIFSTTLNVGLNYIFVRYLGWAVKGVAWATFIAQGLACFLSLFVLLKKARAIDSGAQPVHAFDKKKLATMLRISVPSMIQMSVVSIGPLFVQAVVNGFGSAFMAGYASAVRIHQMMSTVIHMGGSALSTYTAQHIGARRTERIGVGIRSSLAFMVMFSLLMVGVVYLWGERLIALFVDVPTDEVIGAGLFYLRVVVLGMAPFCLFNVFNNVARGAGYMPAFMISTIADLAVRVIFTYACVQFFGNRVMAIAVLVGWGVGIVIASGFHASGRWKKAARI
ncbi:MAG: MATE family efflux transporter [Christensenellales bacterium]|jgi:putative MATE family efflux protein